MRKDSRFGNPVYLFLLSIVFLAIVFSPATSFAQQLVYVKGPNNTDMQGSDVFANDVATDASGNTYVTGTFYNYADFAPGPATLNLLGAAVDMFLVKYNSDGSLAFAKNLGGVYNKNPTGLAVDGSGNIYVTGTYQGTVDFDPGPGTANLSTVSGANDIFIARYDALGNYVYAVSISGNAGKMPNGLAVDPSGNVYITGIFTNTVDFDPGPGTANLTNGSGSADIFVARYDASGNYIYAISIGGSLPDEAYDIVADASGRAYITGYYRSLVDFDPGAGVANLPNSINNDMFFACYDAAGNYVFAKNLSGNGNEEGRGIGLDASGNIYLTGHFSGTLDFDPGAGVINVNSNMGSVDIFIAKYNSSGNYVYAKPIGSNSPDRAYDLTVDAAGTIAITGYFAGTVDFDPGAGIANRTTAGLNDIFVAAYDAAGNYSYAKNMGGTNSDQGNAIARDAAGNTYTTGYFYNSVDFDPDAPAFVLTSGGIAANAFTVKLDNTGVFAYANQIGGYATTGYAEMGKDIATDASGNAYVTGYLAGTVDFDPGPGTATLTASGNFDIFFAKYDALGNYVYAHRIGGTGQDHGLGIAVDASGNVYITGYFNLTADFDPGPATVNLTSTGSTNIFFAKYDASGNYMFARSVGGTGSDLGADIAVDGSENIYLAGNFSNTVDFDPGAGSASLTAGGISADVFVAKYDAAGNYVFARSFGNTLLDNGNGLALGPTGNIYVTGIFDGTVDFDPGPAVANLTSAGGSDMFLAALDAGGNYLLAKRIGSASGENARAIAVDNTGNIYLAGSFSAPIDFDPDAGTTMLTSAGGTDGFIAKYDALGNFLYAHNIGGSSTDHVYSVTADIFGNVYMTGTFIGTVDFDPGAGTTNMTSAGLNDIFLLQLNATGSFVNAKTMGGLASEDAGAVALDVNRNIYVTGYFSLVADFDPSGGSPGSLAQSINNNDFFVAKYGPLSSLPVTLLDFSATVADNQSVHVKWKTAGEKNNSYFEVQRSADGIRFEPVERVAGCNTCNGIQTYHVVDRSPFAGTSFYRLRQVDIDQAFAYSQTRQVRIDQPWQVKIAPSLVQHAFQVVVSGNKQKGFITVQVVNMAGVIVQQEKRLLDEGTRSMEMNFRHQAKGVYQVRIFDQQGKMVNTSPVIRL